MVDDFGSYDASGVYFVPVAQPSKSICKMFHLPHLREFKSLRRLCEDMRVQYAMMIAHSAATVTA